MWHDLTNESRASGKLVLLGVVQEQHPDRSRLFAQWKGFDWPILHDPVNLLKARAVPMFVAIDEAGMVFDANLTAAELPDFLAQPASSDGDQSAESGPEIRSAAELDEAALESNAVADWIAAGDHRILWGGAKEVSTAIKRYASALKSDPDGVDPDNGGAAFRLGVAHRMRYDSDEARPDDFQSAVDAWDRALELDPNHYIYRRRIQQYGPRLIKPYPFYDWIAQARAEITARGDEPIELSVEPVGAEIAAPAKRVERGQADVTAPDPNGRIWRDRGEFVEATAIGVPGTIAKGEAVRVHLQFSVTRTAHWNNEAEPLKVWIELPEGWTAKSPLLTATQPDEPESRETRRIDFELGSPSDAEVHEIEAYALYYICEELGGQCLYRRQDLSIPIRFRDETPRR